jgi:hypothetical protein
LGRREYMRNIAVTNNPPSSPFSVFFLPKTGKGGVITPPFDKGRLGGILVLTNSRGISVIFLIMAILLMITIGYVFSYLIPAKQKSVIFPIQSTQAFFIAQSGVEFAVKYACVNGWVTTADLDANINNLTRNLGSGRFTLTYDFATYGDQLISVGEVPTNTQRRRIVVSNFASFLMGITYFDSASNPGDGGSNTANLTAVTPPGGMQAGDLVLMIAQARASSGTIAINRTGGQTWTSEPQYDGTNCQLRLFWCRFNGNWTGAGGGNPRVSFGSTISNTLVMHVFRPSNTNSVWEVDVAQVSGNFAAPPAPRTVTIPGITTITDGALVFATWASSDDNRWDSLTAGWTTPGSPQYRNNPGGGGNDQSQTHAYRGIPTAAGMPIAGPTGNVSKNEASGGGDAGAYLIIAFRARVI